MYASQIIKMFWRSQATNHMSAVRPPLSRLCDKEAQTPQTQLLSGCTFLPPPFPLGWIGCLSFSIEDDRSIQVLWSSISMYYWLDTFMPTWVFIYAYPYVVYGFLYSSVELPNPCNPPCHRRHVSGQRGVLSVSLIELQRKFALASSSNSNTVDVMSYHAQSNMTIKFYCTVNVL